MFFFTISHSCSWLVNAVIAAYDAGMLVLMLVGGCYGDGISRGRLEPLTSAGSEVRESWQDVVTADKLTNTASLCMYYTVYNLEFLPA